MKRGWEIYRIGDFCDVKTGKLDANASSADGTYPFFTCSKEPLRIETYSYDAECVLVAGNGDLNVKYYKGKFDAYQRTYIITLKEHIKNISVKYLYKFFLLYVETLRSKSIGGVIKYIKLGDITNAKIMIPPIVEQERIVGELDCLSGIIAAKRAQLRELDTLAQSIFYTMFGDPITNDKGWQTKKWESVYETKLGKMLDAKKQNDNDIVCPYIANVNVKWGRFDLENLKTMTFSLKEIELYKLRKGDLLICEGGEAGRCAIWDKSDSNILYQKAIHRSRVKNQDINSYYTLYFLYNFRKQGGLKDYLSKSTIEHLTREKLNTLRLPIPPIALQNEFAEKIEQIEKQKQLIKASIAETEDLFNSRMSCYFD